MARITPEYIRRQFLEQFASMSPERREGTLEALTVLHQTNLLAKGGVTAIDTAPLFTAASEAPHQTEE